MEIKIHYIKTADDLRLQGIEYDSGFKQSCVLFIHGMSGNCIENYFAHVIGQALQTSRTSFIFAHNRGYNHINDIATSSWRQKEGFQTIRIGASYEIFSDCIIDIQAWVEKVKSLGYKQIIILGHSLGAPKVIYYLSEKNEPIISGVGLISPGDMVGLIQNDTYQPNWKDLYTEARLYVEQGKPRKLLSAPIWNWYTLSAQTFLSLFETNGPVDNLPIHDPKQTFDQLSKITQPVLCTMGEFDDITINTIEKDLDIIATKAINTKSFTGKIIPNANHTYDGQEQVLAKTVTDWVNSIR